MIKSMFNKMNEKTYRFRANAAGVLPEFENKRRKTKSFRDLHVQHDYWSEGGYTADQIKAAMGGPDHFSAYMLEALRQKICREYDLPKDFDYIGEYADVPEYIRHIREDVYPVIHPIAEKQCDIIAIKNIDCKRKTYEKHLRELDEKYKPYQFFV